ncbi:hypothetical protein [Butyrivibrio sp. XPD2006]|uniref:hypothetical protein n=1 Tax=Butyrivibrio sp. XPD2006 TaxID=1280668 RepID=UPI0003B42AFE|nr:hypothetical protein [Butyrivibrio sp. XPD2006]
MKTLIIYTSQTGFTKRYAQWLADRVGGDLLDLKDALLHNALTDAQREYIKVFYCQGGMSYEKMNAPTRITMKMFVSAVRNKKDATEEQKEMFERMASSYDISDIKYIEPIAAYLAGMDEEKAV